MSRTTLCLVTAAVLAVVSLAVMSVRIYVLGDEVKAPVGPGTWQVTMVVQGHGQADARLITLAPLDFGRQHVLRESFRSAEFVEKPAEAKHDPAPEAHHPQRRQILWTRRVGSEAGSFRVRYEFYCSLDHKPTVPMSDSAKLLYAPPKQGELLDVDLSGPEGEEVSALAREQTAGLESPHEQAEALFRYVDTRIKNEPSIPGTPARPAECLKASAGDCGEKSHLLLALLRCRGIPARLVIGLTLTKGPEQPAHSWVEGWIDQRWLPMCPSHHHFGHVPPSYLVFAFGETPLVRGRHVRDLEHAFLVERVGAEGAPEANPSLLRRTFLALSLYMLPPAERELATFLLLLPAAALIICVFRNVIGLSSFGTFAPALVGLAFREFHNMPGLIVFVALVLMGWLMRRVLNSYHLLQVPRTAFLLSLVVVTLLILLIAANFMHLEATRYLPVFPMVILTGMIERFWTLETEDSTASSFRTLLGTLLVSGTIALVLSIPAVANHMFRYPETVGLIMAALLVLGRYTGYRLSELYRFRDFVRQ